MTAKDPAFWQAPVPPFLPKTDGLKVSFEFFPPKTEEMELQLWRAIRRLEPLAPAFVSVTYGAGGSTRDRTHHTVRRIVEETTLTPAAHLTCVAASKAEIEAVVRDYWAAGVRHIVALRGDMPSGMRDTGEFHYANELVEFIRSETGNHFHIEVAAYPEFHPQAPTAQQDLRNFKRKVEAGANGAITQYFYSVDAYLRFAEAVNRLDFWPAREAITVDYSEGGLIAVPQHDGSVLKLRKLDGDYDPRDRIVALEHVARAAEKFDATGRLVDERDGPDATQVALISQSLEETQWPGQNPLGRVIDFGGMDGAARHRAGIFLSVPDVGPPPLEFRHGFGCMGRTGMTVIVIVGRLAACFAGELHPLPCAVAAEVITGENLRGIHHRRAVARSRID